MATLTAQKNTEEPGRIRPAEYAARRDAVRTAVAPWPAVFRGVAADETLDGALPGMLQNSVMEYLTGVDTPDTWLLILPAGADTRKLSRQLPAAVREVIFLPGASAAAEQWTGPQLSPGKSASAATGIEHSLDSSSIWAVLQALAAQYETLATVTPFGPHANLTREFAMMRRTTEIAPVVRWRDATTTLTELRKLKSSAEVALIERAVAITGEAHRAVVQELAAKSVSNEAELDGLIYSTYRRHNAWPAFPSIVGSGRNGTVLHYHRNDAPLQDGDLLVLDIGARFHGYCGDVTRTWPISGRFTPRQRELYSLVAEAHRRVVGSAVAGIDSPLDLEDRCKEFYRESGLRAENASGEKQTLDRFLPHGICHHLGVQVHDPGARTDALYPGAVVTIEPGLYLPRERIGIRLEDDYLVTQSGLQRLGPPLPIAPDEVERMFA
ncbi:MAG: aminopeptidase P N-terminal domain-containing protein [Armatimonadetes bacterium]|nr:aminopeptidase P N-terminal domain-containing protein [Armatimonadota bacterium]MDE2206534.1 aminopeptidase P N-terminal domain-containing protein [Armatimonadota bacterium]